MWHCCVECKNFLYCLGRDKTAFPKGLKFMLSYTREPKAFVTCLVYRKLALSTGIKVTKQLYLDLIYINIIDSIQR